MLVDFSLSVWGARLLTRRVAISQLRIFSISFPLATVVDTAIPAARREMKEWDGEAGSRVFLVCLYVCLQKPQRILLLISNCQIAQMEQRKCNSRAYLRIRWTVCFCILSWNVAYCIRWLTLAMMSSKADIDWRFEGDQEYLSSLPSNR